jgi:hypothetical protein
LRETRENRVELMVMLHLWSIDAEEAATNRFLFVAPAANVASLVRERR